MQAGLRGPNAVAGRRTPAVVTLLACVLAFTVAPGPALADVITVKGSAYGFFTNVSLFGGPSSTHGPAPTVTLPADGSATPIVATAPDGLKGQYGPAVVFGGIWPDPAPTGGPSGPITVKTQGTKGAGGSVTSSIDIVMHNPVRPLAPGGIGPGPLIAEEVHTTCTAREAGVTSSVRFVKGIVETKYDENTQLPIKEAIRQIPANPPVNDTYTGTIDHVGDHFRIVLNEQIRHPDGSLTVNAAHMFLLGPIAIGEMIVGQTVCGVTGGPSASPSPQPTSQSPAPTAPASPSPTPTAAPDPSAAATTTTAPSPTTTEAPSSTTTTPTIDATGSSLPNPVGGVPSGAAGGPARGTALAARQAADGGGGFPLVVVLVFGAVGAGAAGWAWRRRMAR